MIDATTKACSTLTFSNLRDTERFNVPQIYRLILKKEGYFKRASITTSSPLMYLTLENIKSTEVIPLYPVLDNREEDLEVVLCEISYRIAWNISEKLGNN